MARGKSGNASVSKTKVGHDWRVRGSKGKIRGEYETKSRAEKKERKLEKKKGGGYKKKKKKGGYKKK